MNDPTVVLNTIGHSNRSTEEFLAILRAHRIEQVVDVRSVPRSRRNPQFDQNALRSVLAGVGINYLHLPSLGGLRQPMPESRNGALTDPAMRGYADQMQTREFQEALDSLLEGARACRSAVMCAEADPAHCHRSLLSDVLAARGICVEHILEMETVRPHRVSPLARIEGGRVSYPDLLA